MVEISDCHHRVSESCSELANVPRKPRASGIGRESPLKEMYQCRLLEAQKAENNGAWPETVAVVLWGTDNIKTYGESLAQVLMMVGINPVSDALGRVNKLEVSPHNSPIHPLWLWGFRNDDLSQLGEEWL